MANLPVQFSVSRRTAGIIAYALLSIIVGAGLGWLALQGFEWAAVYDLLLSINPFLLIAAVILNLAAVWMHGARWRILLASKRVSVWRLFLIEQSSVALDAVSIVRIFAELLQVGILSVRDHFQPGRLLAAIAIQRTLDFTTTIIVIAGGVMLLAPLSAYRPYAAIGLGIAALSLFLFFTVGPRLARVAWLARFNLVRNFSQAAEIMREEWMRSLAAFGLSLMYAAIIGAGGVLLGLSLAIPVESVVAMVVLTHMLIFFGSTIPGLPLAFGTYEFAAVSLLAIFGASQADAFAFTLALRIMLYLPAIAIAAVFLPREGLASRGALKQLYAQYQRRRA